MAVDPPSAYPAGVQTRKEPARTGRGRVPFVQPERKGSAGAVEHPREEAQAVHQPEADRPVGLELVRTCLGGERRPAARCTAMRPGRQQHEQHAVRRPEVVGERTH